MRSRSLTAKLAPPIAPETLETAAEVDPGRTSMFAAFRYRDYRLFWVGHTISNTGTWMQMLGQGWLVVQLAIRDGSPQLAPLYLGLVGLARAVPGLSLGLVAGAVADRADRRQLLLVTQVTACFISLLLGTLTATGAINIWALILVAAASSAVFSFDVPARQSMVPRLVPQHHLMSAIGLNQAAFNGPQVIGPALGGILIVVTDVAGLFFANAATYGAVIAALLLMRPAAIPHGRKHAKVLASIREGLGYIRREPSIRWTSVLAATLAFFVRPSIFLLPAFAANVLHVGATELSYMMSATGVGALAGSLAVANLGSVRRRGRLLLLSTLAAGASLTLFSLQRTLAPALLAALALGLTSIAFNGLTHTIVQSTVPDRLIGRVMSVFGMVFMGIMPLGQMALGALGSAIGVDAVLFVGGVVALAAGAYVALRLPEIRDLVWRPRSLSPAHARAPATAPGTATPAE